MSEFWYSVAGFSPSKRDFKRNLVRNRISESSDSLMDGKIGGEGGGGATHQGIWKPKKLA